MAGYADVTSPADHLGHSPQDDPFRTLNVHLQEVDAGKPERPEEFVQGRTGDGDSSLYIEDGVLGVLFVIADQHVAAAGCDGAMNRRDVQQFVELAHPVQAPKCLGMSLHGNHTSGPADHPRKTEGLPACSGADIEHDVPGVRQVLIHAGVLHYALDFRKNFQPQARLHQDSVGELLDPSIFIPDSTKLPKP